MRFHAAVEDRERRAARAVDDRVRWMLGGKAVSFGERKRIAGRERSERGRKRSFSAPVLRIDHHEPGERDLRASGDRIKLADVS